MLRINECTVTHMHIYDGKIEFQITAKASQVIIVSWFFG